MLQITFTISFCRRIRPFFIVLFFQYVWFIFLPPSSFFYLIECLRKKQTIFRLSLISQHKMKWKENIVIMENISINCHAASSIARKMCAMSKPIFLFLWNSIVQLNSSHVCVSEIFFRSKNNIITIHEYINEYWNMKWHKHFPFIKQSRRILHFFFNLRLKCLSVCVDINKCINQ